MDCYGYKTVRSLSLPCNVYMLGQILFEFLDKSVLISLLLSLPQVCNNNIFFSFAVDSDYEDISKDHKPDCQNGSAEAPRFPPQM
jgi:hypothetical protein